MALESKLQTAANKNVLQNKKNIKNARTWLCIYLH